MKAVPSYTFVPEVAGKGKALRHLRHTAVKGGVKTRHLWQPGKARRHRLDALDGTRQVQGRKGDQPSQLGEERRIHSLRGRMVRAAMDHPMAHGDRGRKAQVLGRRGYAFGRRRMVGEIAVDIYQRLVVRAPDPEVSTGQTDALHRAVGEPHLFHLSKAIEGELQGRGAAVETQDDVLSRCRIRLHRCPRRRSEHRPGHPSQLGTSCWACGEASRVSRRDCTVTSQTLSASVELLRPAAASCWPHVQLLISGMSSPCSAMYCLCSMSLSRIACLA